ARAPGAGSRHRPLPRCPGRSRRSRRLLGHLRSGRPCLGAGVSAGVRWAGVARRRLWPPRAGMRYNWDAVQFALALREFDVVKHQPHPPGYLLYVGLGRLLNASLGDPTLAYVALAMLFSTGSTFALYALARRLYDRATAL